MISSHWFSVGVMCLTAALNLANCHLIAFRYITTSKSVSCGLYMTVSHSYNRDNVSSFHNNEKGERVEKSFSS